MPLPLYPQPKRRSTLQSVLSRTPSALSPGLRYDTGAERGRLQAATGVNQPPLDEAPGLDYNSADMNKGGTITAGGITRNYAPTPRQNTDPNRPGSGGTITNSLGLTRSFAGGMRPRGGINYPSVAQLAAPSAPVSSPTTRGAQQTESANPLTGASNAQPAGTTERLNPAANLGFTRQRGVANGYDAVAPGGTREVFDDFRSGPMAATAFGRRFGNARDAQSYTSRVRQLYGI